MLCFMSYLVLYFAFVIVSLQILEACVGFSMRIKKHLRFNVVSIIICPLININKLRNEPIFRM